VDPGAAQLTDPVMQVEHLAADREFFIRKGIGEALREYSKTDPNAVVTYVAAHEAELSPLSRREALRRISI
jgi:3-methyladenine DNA glycosylase AlkD